MLLVLFVLFEVLLVPALLRLCGVKGPLLVSSTLVLLICPFIRFNPTADFCMRASIPSITVLCVLSALVLKPLVQREPLLGIRRKAVVGLIVVLLLGSFTPAMEFYRGFNAVSKRGIAKSVNDTFGSFEGREGWPRTNYVIHNSNEKTPPFLLIASDREFGSFVS